MSKPRTCPHCGASIPVDTGFHYDENLNLICDKCGKTAFAVIEVTESTGNYHGAYSSHTSPGGQPYKSHLPAGRGEVIQHEE